MGSFQSYEPVPQEVLDERIKHHLASIKPTSTCAENKLREENEYLKSVNSSLEKEVQILKENVSPENGVSLTDLSNKELRDRSEANINKYIEAILANPDTNIGWLPDIVERRIYKNIATLLLNAMETTVKSSEIKILGHRLRFAMDPIIESDTSV